MKMHSCNNLIFSSSTTVYGKQKSPLRETSIVGQNITNPYGQTKYMIEQIFRDFCIANNNWNIIVLRYFNPIGAHPSGLIRENPNDIPNNLMPYVLKVAPPNNQYIERLRKNEEKTIKKQFRELMIFSNDYDTPDGTCQRDFIHVVDLEKGHMAALQKINILQHFHVFNLGTGIPTSVLEMVEMCKKVNNIKIPFRFAPRREGDIDVCYCDPEYTFNMLGWKTRLTLEDICRIKYLGKNFFFWYIIKMSSSLALCEGEVYRKLYPSSSWNYSCVNCTSGCGKGRGVPYGGADGLAYCCGATLNAEKTRCSSSAAVCCLEGSPVGTCNGIPKCGPPVVEECPSGQLPYGGADGLAYCCNGTLNAEKTHCSTRNVCCLEGSPAGTCNGIPKCGASVCPSGQLPYGGVDGLAYCCSGTLNAEKTHCSTRNVCCLEGSPVGTCNGITPCA